MIRRMAGSIGMVAGCFSDAELAERGWATREPYALRIEVVPVGDVAVKPQR